MRRAHHLPVQPRLDRDRAARARLQLGLPTQPGNIGLPAPGVELKLVPNDGKLEARLQGPQHHAGLLAAARPHRARPSTRRAIYKIGDALKFADPADPAQGPAVRRPHRRGLQARERHLGQRGRAARAVRRSLRAAGSRRGDRRRRPRRHRACWCFPTSRPAASSPGLAADAPPAAVLGDAKRARRVPPPARRAGAAEHRQLDPHLPADPDGRAALARRRRSHRQGLDQPARGADAPRRAGRGALCRARRSDRRRSQSTQRTVESHGPQRTRRHRHRRRLRPRRRDRGGAGARRRQGRAASTSTSTARSATRGKIGGIADPLRRHQRRRRGRGAQAGARQARRRAHPGQLRRHRPGQAHGRPRRADAARRVREGDRGQPDRHLQHDAARRRRHADRSSRSPTASAA